MKIIVSVTLTLAILLSLAVGAGVPTNSVVVSSDSVKNPNYRLGYINGDDEITIFDVLEILKYLVGIPSKISDDENAVFAARIVNSDEGPTIFDAMEILKYLVGIENMIDKKKPIPMPSETTASPSTTTNGGNVEPPETTSTDGSNEGDEENMQPEIVFVAVGFYPYFGVWANNPPESYAGYFIENNGTVRKFSFENVYEHWTFGTLSIDGFPKTIKLNDNTPQKKLLSHLSGVSEFEIVGNVSMKELESHIRNLSDIDASVNVLLDFCTADVIQGYVEIFGVRYNNDNNTEVVFINGIGGINFNHTDENAVKLNRWLSELFELTITPISLERNLIWNSES